MSSNPDWTLHPYNESHGGNLYTDTLSEQAVVLCSKGTYLICTTLIQGAPMIFHVEFSERERFFEVARRQAIVWKRQEMLESVPDVVAKAKVVQKDKASGVVNLFDL